MENLEVQQEDILHLLFRVKFSNETPIKFYYVRFYIHLYFIPYKFLSCDEMSMVTICNGVTYTYRIPNFVNKIPLSLSRVLCSDLFKIDVRFLRQQVTRTVPQISTVGLRPYPHQSSQKIFSS